MPEFEKWIRGLFRHWMVLLGGGGVALFQFVYSLRYQSSPPIVAWLILAVCFFAAAFLAWRDEHKKAEDLEQRLRPRLRVTVDKKSIANAIWNGSEWMIFLRVIVSSLTQRRIEGGKAYLVSIEKDSKILWDNEEVPLNVCPGGSPRRAEQDNRTWCKLSGGRCNCATRRRGSAILGNAEKGVAAF